MSFGGSQWCRPMSMDAHRSTDHDEDRSMDYSNQRSTSSAESTAECSAVRIMTHEEFAENNPTHPPLSTDRINALRPPPKPLANPPEPTTNPSDTTPEPMKVDEATEGRRLRKRKEKIRKNLKREANEKEMDGFTKRVLRIPVEKPFDEVYYTHRLWMFFRETKETEEDIRRMFHHVRERMKLRITLKKKSDPGKFAIPCVVKDDDLWQVVKHEKLGEGDFKVESSMSLGGSQWCRPMSMNAHRSTDHDEDRSTDYSNYRSTSSAKSTAECSAVRIMTHEEFAEKHPHPPSPFYVKSIDSMSQQSTDRERLISIDPPSPPIDRRAPLTYRVRLPSIDSDRIKALRPPPKPLANPPEPITNPSDTTQEPMKVDEATEGRRLRKRKEKIPKTLKRDANEKEMDGFTKRVLRIPVEKPFGEVYYTHRLWMFFRETKETEEDIRRMFHHVREWHEKLGEGDFEVERSMSFGGSQWCRPMSMAAHRSTDHYEDRSTYYSNHRSTASAKSTPECSAVRIKTHEEFAEKHTHPPSPFYVKIDRRHEPAVDRQRETDIDRHPSPPIDRRAPLTYRVRLPSIDSD
ncbi:hypothetical protein F2Q69_00012752 [Brassica cretica]|uniref:Uncharacterized protein n=1 Tax=Brassica cretica TaxID=69181 RepID=A0A8S9R8N3_BRACR|nr:hypothetical protein F2Q69_00012752 [Brassica cretica]